MLSDPYLKHGGLITLLGPVPASSAVLAGDAKRSSEYLAGKRQYR
jgi:hypothetical protein